MDSSPERDNHDASGDHDLEHYVQQGGEQYAGMEDHYEGHDDEEHGDHDEHHYEAGEDDEGQYHHHMEDHEEYDGGEGHMDRHQEYDAEEYEDHEEGHEEDDGHPDQYGYKNEYGDYGEGGITEFEMMFENASRKIKRDILDNLNKIRQEKGMCRLYTDLFSSLIANDYAEYLKSNEDDPEIFKQLCDEYNNFGDLKLVFTKSKLEEDTNIAEAFYQELINLGYLLLEVESDRKVLLDPELNHIGIGVAMTEDTVILVEIFSRKYLSVYHV